MTTMQILLRAFERLLSVGGIAGLIALGIAATICLRYLQRGPEEIPQILTYSLTTIIGFYFGTGISRPQNTEHSN
jgi:hypothetical protein